MQENLNELTNKYPVSDAELERRLNVTQQKMKAEGLDCLIVQSHSIIYDANIRYFLDMRTDIRGSALIIPASGKITAVWHGPDNDNAPIPPWIRNVEKFIVNHYCQVFPFTDENAAKIVEKEIRERGFKVIGLAGLQLMSYSFGAYLTRNLTDVKFVNFSDQLNEIQAIKSTEEWELIDMAIKAHDKLINAVPSLIRPGRRAFEIHAEVNSAAIKLGCEYMGNLQVAAATPGIVETDQFEGSHKILAGDYVRVLIEVSGPGGMYGEVARLFSLGKPADGLVEVWELSNEAQHRVAEASKPGATGADLSRVFNEFAVKNGVDPNRRYIGHGQGYDMMQAPAINDNEQMVLKEDMLLAIHPLVHKGAFISMCCDNYRVTKSGGKLLQTTPQQIFIV